MFVSHCLTKQVVKPQFNARAYVIMTGPVNLLEQKTCNSFAVCVIEIIHFPFKTNL